MISSLLWYGGWFQRLVHVFVCACKCMCIFICVHNVALLRGLSEKFATKLNWKDFQCNRNIIMYNMYTTKPLLEYAGKVPCGCLNGGNVRRFVLKKKWSLNKIFRRKEIHYDFYTENDQKVNEPQHGKRADIAISICEQQRFGRNCTYAVCSH